MPDLIFPLPTAPKDPFWEKNQTSFGWNRDGGSRKHAGIDLVADTGTPVLAMADGQVLRVKEFYQGTWAIEIQHPGFGIVRYGEVSPTTLVFEGLNVKQGFIIGFVGRRKGATRAMVHLELFSDWTTTDTAPEKGGLNPLSDPTNPPYQRRTDLKDPTSAAWCALHQTWCTALTSSGSESDTRLAQVLSRLRLYDFKSSAPGK